MRTIKFLVDYRGMLTREKYYLAGAIEAFPLSEAEGLVEAGVAEWYVEDELVLAVDLDDLTVKQLKAKAKAAKVKGYGRMNKAELIAELRDD
jgi:hypothetical protein